MPAALAIPAVTRTGQNHVTADPSLTPFLVPVEELESEGRPLGQAPEDIPVHGVSGIPECSIVCQSAMGRPYAATLPAIGECSGVPDRDWMASDSPLVRSNSSTCGMRMSLPKGSRNDVSIP